MDLTPTSSIPASSPHSQTQSNSELEPHKEKPAPKSKRARPTISCLECRRKKLKCDRIQPCMQCTKSGKEALCTFANPPVAPKPQEALQHRPAENPNKRAKLHGLASPESSVDSNNKPAQLLTPGRVSCNTVQSEASCGREDELDDECPWLSSNTGPERRDKVTSNLARGEKKCLGKIYIKNGRSRFLGVGDRMVLLDHVNVFLLFNYEEPLANRSSSKWLENLSELASKTLTCVLSYKKCWVIKNAFNLCSIHIILRPHAPLARQLIELT